MNNIYTVKGNNRYTCSKTGSSFFSTMLSTIENVVLSYNEAAVLLDEEEKKNEKELSVKLAAEMNQLIRDTRKLNRENVIDTIEAAKMQALNKLTEIQRKEISSFSGDIQETVQLINTSGPYMSVNELQLIADKYKNISVIQRALRSFTDKNGIYIRTYKTIEQLKELVETVAKEAKNNFDDGLKWSIFESISLSEYDSVLKDKGL